MSIRWRAGNMTRRSSLALLMGLTGAALGWRGAGAGELPPRQASQKALNAVTRWGIQYQNVDLQAVAASNLDLIVLDPSLNDAELRFIRREECKLIKTKRDGTRRLVLAYLCVGEVDTKRWYWPARLLQAPPKWVGPENPNWPGSRSVMFWAEEWQKLVFQSHDSIL